MRFEEEKEDYLCKYIGNQHDYIRYFLESDASNRTNVFHIDSVNIYEHFLWKKIQKTVSNVTVPC